MHYKFCGLFCALVTSQVQPNRSFIKDLHINDKVLRKSICHILQSLFSPLRVLVGQVGQVGQGFQGCQAHHLFLEVQVFPTQMRVGKGKELQK